MSDSLKELKKKILEDEKVEQLLEELGCLNIKYNAGRSGDDLITAQLPDGDNRRAVQIYMNENLSSSIVNKGISGNIFTIVGYILYDCQDFDNVRSHLYQIKTYICNALNYSNVSDDFFTSKPQPKTDWNWWLRNIQNQRKREIEITKNEVLDERILNEFVNDPWGDWYIKDGISLETQRLFGIGFHVLTERVTIPVHNKDGQLIGVKGRYYGTDEAIKKDKKYNYIYPCSKNIELFNLHRAIPFIQKRKKVFAFEGAKTTMVVWDWGIENAVSWEGDKLSPVQVKLFKDLGLDVDLYFLWDKGKDKEFVEKQLKQIKNRNVYYVIDEEGLLEDKMSPTDRGFEVFKQLFNNGTVHFTKIT